MLLTQRHKQKCLAHAEADNLEQLAVLNSPYSPISGSANSTDYKTALAMLEKHREQLHAITSVEDKIAFKRQQVSQYLPYLNAYIDSGAHYQNDVLTHICVWLIDIEDFETALTFAEYAITQQQLSPARYKRDFPTLIAELICDWAERQYQDKLSAYPYFDQVVERVINEQWLISQLIVTTKIIKLSAMFAEREENYLQAVELYEKCTEINPEKHGVKGRLEAAQKKLDSQQQAPSADERSNPT